MGIMRSNESHQKEVEERQSMSYYRDMISLKDGDEAAIAFVATGEDTDKLLDDFFVHSLTSVSDSGQPIFPQIYCTAKSAGEGEEGEECKWCDTGNRPKQKFGVWGYVYEIRHAVSGKTGEVDWEEKALPTGQKQFVESVEALKIFTQGFGQSDAIWNQLVDIYNEDNTLDKWIVRIKRTGARLDTTYMIRPTKNVAQISDETKAGISKLAEIKSFFKSAYKERDVTPQAAPSEGSADNGAPKKEVVDIFGDDDEDEKNDADDIFGKDNPLK